MPGSRSDGEARSYIHTVPTFVGRRSGYLDLACTFMYVLIVNSLGVPLWLAVPPGP